MEIEWEFEEREKALPGPAASFAWNLVSHKYITNG